MIVSGIFGGGIGLTPEQFSTVNKFCILHGREALLHTPGKQCFEYGKNCDGWWYYAKFFD
jgi:hypothetical protein